MRVDLLHVRSVLEVIMTNDWAQIGGEQAGA